jgi:microcin C transport system substrate-binding protein
MSGTKLYSTRILFLIGTLLILSIFSACGKNADEALTEGSDESVSLDYSVQPVTENLKWITNNDEPLIASPKAKKGGTLNKYILSFPLTFRTVGPDSNSSTRSYFLDNHLGLLGYHNNTEKILPELATHWAYGKDGRTMYFKIHPDAVWSDGAPVTADDFIFAFEFMLSKHIQSPFHNEMYAKEYEKIVKHGDKLISITASKKVPDLWYYLNMQPKPKHFYGKINKNYVTEYNWKVEPNTGPYVLKDFSKGKYLLFERNKNWWAKDLRYNVNRFNVDFIRISVIRDENVAFEHFKKGLIDTYDSTRPEIWYDKGNDDVFKSGYANKIVFYNQAKRPTPGLYLNLDKEIFKDKNLRLALAHAINFDKVNSQIMRNDATRLNTCFEGYGDYTNKEIRAREFDIKKSESYMKASGWKRGTGGIWEKGNSRFSVTLTYGRELFTPRVIIYQEEAKKAGIDLKLELLDPSTWYKKVSEKKHDITYLTFSTGFRPEPWQHFHSENAHKAQTNNITNIDDPEMDRMIDKYRNSINEKERMDLSRKIQKKVHDSASWIPLDVIPFFREFHWRWMQFPEIPGDKDTGDIFDNPAGSGLFWIDEDIKKETLDALKSNKTFEPVTKIITKYKQGSR